MTIFYFWFITHFQFCYILQKVLQQKALKLADIESYFQKISLSFQHIDLLQQQKHQQHHYHPIDDELRVQHIKKLS